MYVTGLQPGSKKPLAVPRKQSERMEQRRVLERGVQRKIVTAGKIGPKKKR
jgi:hypothetical protein